MAAETRSRFRWRHALPIGGALAVLVALLAVFAIRAYRERLKWMCGLNQRQIALTMAVYNNDSDVTWPVFAASRSGANVALSDPAFDPVATTIASFELVFVVTGGDLMPRTFACPAGSPAYPTAPAMIPVRLDGRGPHRSSWAAGGPGTVGYAYDWSVPGNSSSQRVVLADRDTAVHHGATMAVFTDGHAEALPRCGGAFTNPHAADDDIYSATGDGPMDMPGAGSTTRAFVR